MDSVVTFGGPMDRMLLLRTMPIFEGLGPNQLAAIAQHAKERFEPRGAKIRIDTGARQSVLLVVEGELTAIADTAPARFGKGEAVAFVETIAGADTVLMFEATVDTMLLELDWEAQISVCEEHFAVIMSYIAFLSSRLIERTQRIAEPEYGPIPLIAEQDFGDVLDLNERLLLLSRSGAFSPRCLDALSELAQQGQEMRFSKGQVVWAEGQAANHFLVIAAGSLRMEDQDGKAAIYRAGTAAGMAESLSRYNRRFSAVCTEPTVALRLQIEAFMDILEDHFDLSLDVMATLARRLSAASTD